MQNARTQALHSDLVAENVVLAPEDNAHATLTEGLEENPASVENTKPFMHRKQLKKGAGSRRKSWGFLGR